MFVLVEPCLINKLLDRPDLGCAMLIASCQERGIKTTLIKGQTRYIKEIFLDNSQEIWHLLMDLKLKDLKNVGLEDLKRKVRAKGEKQFRSELRSLYQRIFIKKNMVDYIDGRSIEIFKQLYDSFRNLYFYYLSYLNMDDLSIINNYVKQILQSNPQYVGFSLNDFDPFSLAIRKRVKQARDIPIIAGGQLTPFVGLEKANSFPEYLYVDYFIIGPGEESLPLLIKSLQRGKEPSDIANVFYNKNGKALCNRLKPVLDLNSLPFPDFSKFDLDLYLSPLRILPFQTARGCSWGKCSFCNYKRVNFDVYKAMSAEREIEVIEYLRKQYKCNHFMLHNDDFPPQRARSLSQLILDREIKDITIAPYARFDKGFDDQGLLSLMYKAGIKLIMWGMESGSQRILNLMKKGTKLSMTSRILKKSSKYKIINYCMLIFGFPGESVADAEETIKYLENNSSYIDILTMQTFKPGYYCEVAKNPRKWGLKGSGNSQFGAFKNVISKDTEDFFERTVRQLELNNLQILSKKPRFVFESKNYYNFMLSAALVDCGLFDYSSAEDLFDRKNIGDIFPLILGDCQRKGKHYNLRPIKVYETSFVNRYIPSKKMVISDIEYNLVNLSDATLSIESIIKRALKKTTKKRRDKTREECIIFFRKMFLNQTALGFSSSLSKYKNSRKN